MFITGFKERVHNVLNDNARRMSILANCLSPALQRTYARELQRPDFYNRLLQALEERYGQADRVSEACLDRLLSLPPTRDGDLQGLIRFQEELSGCVATLQLSGFQTELESSTLLRQVVGRLPNGMLDQWSYKLLHLRKLSEKPTVVHVADWIAEVVEAKVSVAKLKGRSNSFSSNSTQKGDPKAKKSVNVVSGHQEGKEILPCFACDQPHPIERCENFRELSASERAVLVKEKHHCFNCLRAGHRSKDCRSKSCSESGCKGRHHHLLHGAARITPQKKEIAVNQIQRTPMQTEEISYSVLLNIVPVIVRANGREIPTFALLDRGSEASLISRKISETLKITHRPTALKLSTFHGQDPNLDLALVSFDIMATDRSVSFGVKDALLVPRIKVSHRSINWPSEKSKWPFLKDLDLPAIDTTCLGILIGMDIPEAHEYSRIAKPPPGAKGPIAIKSPFGWTVGGHVPKTVVTRHVNSIHASQEDSNLEKQIARWWEIESFGIGHDSGNPLSSQDSKALDMLKSSLRFKDSHYEVGLLWREEEVSLPDNRNTALRRLYALERRFAREAPAFVQRYASAIECYVKDGHARKLNHSEVMVQHQARYPQRND